jgi:diphosphomevalonate decarboxylase
MSERSATAIGPANIAFTKYWGVRDPELTLPYNGSLSMNLDNCLATTTVSFDAALDHDEVTLRLFGQEPQAAQRGPHGRVTAQLDRIRRLAGVDTRAHVFSENNFPADAGIASSAAAFAALTLASAAALELELDERQLTILTRQSGSGSACRSIPSGYVEWISPANASDRESYAVSVAPPEHWALADVVAVVDAAAKKTGSAENHRLVATSPYFATRLAEVPARTAAAREAVLSRDLRVLGPLIEADAVSMHAICMTMNPPSFYWSPGTLAVIHAVREWREQGLESYFTIDAGPNVHVICEQHNAEAVAAQLAQLPGVQFTISNGVGAGARLATRTNA